jgi:hypothetical protein
MLSLCSTTELHSQPPSAHFYKPLSIQLNGFVKLHDPGKHPYVYVHIDIHQLPQLSTRYHCSLGICETITIKMTC